MKSLMRTNTRRQRFWDVYLLLLELATIVVLGGYLGWWLAFGRGAH